jgi:hypothetical protein
LLTIKGFFENTNRSHPIVLGIEKITIDFIVPKWFRINPEVKLAIKPPNEIIDAANASSFFCIVNIFSSFRSFGPAGALHPNNDINLIFKNISSCSTKPLISEPVFQEKLK